MDYFRRASLLMAAVSLNVLVLLPNLCHEASGQILLSMSTPVCRTHNQKTGISSQIGKARSSMMAAMVAIGAGEDEIDEAEKAGDDLQARLPFSPSVLRTYRQLTALLLPDQPTTLPKADRLKIALQVLSLAAHPEQMYDGCSFIDQRASAPKQIYRTDPAQAAGLVRDLVLADVKAADGALLRTADSDTDQAVRDSFHKDGSGSRLDRGASDKERTCVRSSSTI